MLYYKNIAKFPIICDGVTVLPGEIHEANHFLNNRHMLRVSKPEPVVEVIEEVKPLEPIVESTKTTVMKENSTPTEPVKVVRRRSSKSKTNLKNNIENKSEEIDNG